MLVIAFVFTGLIVAIISHYIGSSFSYLFHTSLATYADAVGWQHIVGIVLIEFAILAVLSVGINDRVLTGMIRKI